jgi:hypothetical protein
LDVVRFPVARSSQGFDRHMTKPVEVWALEELLSNGNGR